MNGRVYDYNLGRFLSVDPFIQAPGNSQSINPYSYIMNNPLSGTDPTGYLSEDDKVEVDKIETEKVAVTGSRLKSHTKTTISGKVTKSDGSTKSFSQTTISNGAGRTVSSSSSYGKTTEIGAQSKIAMQSSGSQGKNSSDGGYDFGISELPLREMLSDSETYSGAIANLAGSMNDGELRGMLGSENFKNYRNELMDAFNTGWDKVRLANSIMAPGFIATPMMGFVKALEGYTRSNTLIRQASSKVIDYTLKPFKKFNSLPKAQKDACVGIAMNLCGSGSVLDDLLKPNSPYSLPKTGPSKYSPAGEAIIHPRRYIRDEMFRRQGADMYRGVNK
ncbi:MAG: RHS repeat-associated core domain-containing protein [Marinomonas sp.]